MKVMITCNSETHLFMAILGLGYFPLQTNLTGEVYTIYKYRDH